MLNYLETKRLRLKIIDPKTYNQIMRKTDEEICELLHLSSEELREEKNKFSCGISTWNLSFVRFHLILKETNTAIGHCSFHTWRTDHHRAEIGYALYDISYSGRGLMEEAARAVINYGFSHMALVRIEAFIGPSNIPSKNLIKKLGFSREGEMRNHYLRNGVWENSVIYSLLKNEYPEHNKQ